MMAWRPLAYVAHEDFQLSTPGTPSTSRSCDPLSSESFRYASVSGAPSTKMTGASGPTIATSSTP